MRDAAAHAARSNSPPEPSRSRERIEPTAARLQLADTVSQRVIDISRCPIMGFAASRSEKCLAGIANRCHVIRLSKSNSFRNAMMEASVAT